MKKILVFIFLLAVSWSCGEQKADDKSNTAKVILVNDEVKRFWKIFSEEDSSKRVQLLIAHALDSVNNPAINTIYNMGFDVEDTLNFIARFNQFLPYYETIKEQTLAMAEQDYPLLNEYYTKFKALYPDAHRPKIIFTVGVLTVGGTITPDGLVIGTEFYGKGDSKILGIMANYLLESQDFVPVTFHEQMHYEQLQINPDLYRSLERTLLTMSLNEGAADFVSNLVTHWNDKRPNYVYGREHEAELWAKFKTELDSTRAIFNWMYDYKIEKDTPPDLGYFMGAKICESYYNNAKDKSEAIKDILSIREPKAFLKASGYAEKFEN